MGKSQKKYGQETTSTYTISGHTQLHTCTIKSPKGNSLCKNTSYNIGLDH